MMHDMDFFIAEARVAEFADADRTAGLKWWALGRIDTLMRYSDRTWQAMARSGLKMVFSGAESSSEATLAAMNKGGTASPELALELAARMKRFGVVPGIFVRPRLAARSRGGHHPDVRVHPPDQGNESRDRSDSLHLHAGAGRRGDVRRGDQRRLRVS